MKLPKLKTFSTFDPSSARWSSYASIFLFLSAFLLAIAFVTPYWLDSETHTNQRFRRLGLWEICFEKFEDPYHRFDRVVSGCKFIFDRDYEFIKEFLKPSKYIYSIAVDQFGYSHLKMCYNLYDRGHLMLIMFVN